WGQCSFCKTDLPMIRCYQQPEYGILYNQLKLVIRDTGIHVFHFSDESNDLALLEYISKRLIDEEIKIKWYGHSRVDKGLTKERCKIFLEAGCEYLALGIESFNPRILRMMNKGITVNLIEGVLNQIDGVLPLVAYMIVGFPTETEEEALEGFEKIQQFMKKGLIMDYTYSLLMIPYSSDIWNLN
ncbi:radical SAM protein, partial [candidate division KSB1 bacterium]|nr:radical SAM protein [candidate division KSB1 bacterium]